MLRSVVLGNCNSFHPEDSDLAQLRSLNDGECSADWYQFQESVAHLQVGFIIILSLSLSLSLSYQLLEEEVVETHKNLLDNMEHWLQQDASLLAMTNEVDYDQDGEDLEHQSKISHTPSIMLFVFAYR